MGDRHAPESVTGISRNTHSNRLAIHNGNTVTLDDERTFVFLSGKKRRNTHGT
jgi:hypothetical protein